MDEYNAMYHRHYRRRRKGDALKCIDSRPCYARNGGECIILNETYKKDGACPFCKERRE